MKPKRCQECGQPFERRQLGQKVCSTACALLWASKHPEVIEKVANASERLRKQRMRKEKREGLERLMTRSDHIKRTQKAVNLYVRTRDAGKPCFTCGAPDKAGVKRDAGHWLSCGAHPAKRFDTRQIRAQCVWCNQHRSGAPLLFKEALIKELGAEIVADIEKPVPPAKWTIEELKSIETEHKAMTKALLDSR